MNRRVGHVVRGIERTAIAEAARHLREKGHELARDLDRVDAVGCQCGVRFVAAHAAAVALFSLVRDDDTHARRLADDAA